MTDQAQPSAKLGRVVAIVNQKGGVGKTTTAINLATSIALAGHRVLAVDVDPQGNLTRGLGWKERVPEDASVYEALLSDRDPASFVLPTGVESLSIIPA